MNTDNKHRFILPRKGIKHTCPSCGARKAFRRYIDTYSGEEIDNECGICDHLNRCGYHLPPREYFRLHPEKREDWKEKHPVPENWTKVGANVGKEQKTNTQAVCPTEGRYDTLPHQYVEQYHSPQSNFMLWLLSIADKLGVTPDDIMRVHNEYLLGSTADRRVVFWQINQKGEVRSGKLMQYTSDGHRTGNPNWMHCVLQGKPDVAKDYILLQCLFGEHLLPRYPERDVALVESEKTAILCAVVHPDRLWLATGGCAQLNVEKLSVLIGRKVYIYPDSGEFLKWYRAALQVKDLNFDISSQMEHYPPNTDIADLILMGNEE